MPHLFTTSTQPSFGFHLCLTYLFIILFPQLHQHQVFPSTGKLKRNSLALSPPSFSDWPGWIIAKLVPDKALGHDTDLFSWHALTTSVQFLYIPSVLVHNLLHLLSLLPVTARITTLSSQTWYFYPPSRKTLSSKAIQRVKRELQEVFTNFYRMQSIELLNIALAHQCYFITNQGQYLSWSIWKRVVIHKISHRKLQRDSRW